MTSNFHPKPSMPNASSAGHNPQTSPGAYSPSVPMSLYRELAAELQATKVMLDSLNNQNQQLNQQNQHLRREVEKVVHAALHLQQVADTSTPGSWNQPTYTHPEMWNEPTRSVPESRSTPRRTRPVAGANPGMDVQTAFADVEPAGSIFQERLVIEQPETRNRRRSQSEKSPEVNGWWVTLAIVLIVISAFGAGFLIMRPLLPKK